MKKNPSKTNNQFGIDYAFPGLCGYCHCEIANFNGSKEVSSGIFRPIITSLKPNYRESTFLLDDGTKIQIPLCEDCDDDIEPEHMNDLMESEINGWQKEVDIFWNEKEEIKKEEHMEEMSKRFVTLRTNRPWKESQLSKLTKPRKEKLKIKVRSK